MWQSEIVTMLRVLLNDLGDTPMYSNATLEKLVVVSAFQVLQEARFTQPFVADITTVSITPDPCDSSSRDDDFINLVCLKSACTNNRGEASAAANKAIAFREGGTFADLRGPLQGRLELLKVSWCAAFQSAMDDYKRSSSGVVGAVILTPFRNYYGAYRADNIRANGY